ncbi:retrovirus-related pol polyprotein from transposon TNT 1-94 [Tanacetum coccineum]
MDSENYKEGQSMQRPPLFEANCFIYWKNHFETYVKSKDIDLWYIIAYGNYKPTIKDKDDKLVGNLKVYEVVLDKDLESAKNKKEKYKSLALKSRQVLSDEDASSSDSNDEEYAMAVRDFKKPRKRQERRPKKPSSVAISKPLLSDCPKNSFTIQKAIVVVLKDSGDDNEEILSHGTRKRDHGPEFDNEVQFGAFCDANGISHNFLAPSTQQSNGVVERKNRTLQEMARTMLNEPSITQKFWCNAVDTSTYILNRILIRPFLGKTPYELFKGKKPSLEHFKVFGIKCFILNTKDYLTKFDPKSTEGVFLGYSPNSKAYIVLNKETTKVEESLNVKFDETPPPKSSLLVDDDILENDIIENQDKDLEIKENEPLNKEITNIKSSKDHP